jgi:drug/metabolite transporter (DMT)-like permease
MTDFQIGGLALFGDILAFLAAGVVALYFITGQAVRRTTGAVTYTVFSYGIGVVFLFVYALIRQDVLFGFSSSTWMALIGLALVATVGGQFLFNILLKRVSATAVTMSILGEPVGTCILAYFIFGDVVSVQQFFGICVILTGLSIYFLWPVLREHFERGKQN